jgi:hypothetical protein
MVEWPDSATPSSAFHRVGVGHVVGSVAHTAGEHAWAVRALDTSLQVLSTVAPRTLARLDGDTRSAPTSGW